VDTPDSPAQELHYGQPSRRRFDYDRRLLPNSHIAVLEPDHFGAEEVEGTTDWSLGYPAWNLLYYALYCSLVPEHEDPIVVETGTNRGIATIVMAQAIRDVGLGAVVETVELDPELVEVARENVAAAGLTDYVRFHVEDAVSFLSKLASRVDHLDFVLLDASHKFRHVLKEIEIVCPKVAACGGKVYFDNTTQPGVDRALRELRRRFGGNVIRFENCSWRPPGNAIWQPD
jgi:cephalosporin hydroxylase